MSTEEQLFELDTMINEPILMRGGISKGACIQTITMAIRRAEARLLELKVEKEFAEKRILDEELSKSLIYPWLNRYIVDDALFSLRQLPASSVDLIVTSPPYNNGTPYTHHCDDMPREQYIEWQRDALVSMMRVLKPNGAIFYIVKQRIEQKLLSKLFSLITLPFPVRQEIIWKRPSTPNHNPAFFAPLSEKIYLITKPDFRLINGGGKCGDVWELPFETNTKHNNPHPAPFPISIPARCIEATDAKIILDPFAGSGSTAIAAERLGRKWICFDNSPIYKTLFENRLYSERDKKLVY